MHKIKKAVKCFCKKMELNKITSAALMDAINDMGYSIVKFDRYACNKDVALLLDMLDLTDYSKSVKAFTYADKQNRCVFILDGLSADEEIILLSHEAGHIYLGHLGGSANVFGRSIVQENEANEFSFYLLNRTTFSNMLQALLIRKKLMIVLASCILLSASGACIIKYHSDNNHYYITRTGAKYHKKDCIYIRGKDDLTEVDLETAKKLYKEPCSVCIGK